jgi:hypothetical protein
MPSRHTRSRRSFIRAILTYKYLSRFGDVTSDEKLQPSKKWPNAANGRTRSQTIFVIARHG